MPVTSVNRELRLGAPQWTLDLVVFSAALCAIASAFFLPNALDANYQYRDGAMLLTIGPVVVGSMTLLGLPAILRPGPGSLTAVRTIAVVLCVTVLLLPVGAAILVGLRRTRPGTWRYGAASRWTALLLVVPLLASGALDLGLAIDREGLESLPAITLLTAILLAGAGGVMLRQAWARPIAAAGALLTGLTGGGLPLALPALVLLWRGGSRVPLDVPDVTSMAEPPPAPERYHPSSLVTVVTALVCVGVYLAEFDPRNPGYALIGAGPEPTLVRLGAVNGPAIARGEVWRIITAGYLHAGVLHLSLNMVALLVAGLYVERRYGRVRTAILYLGSMVAGNLLAAVLSARGSYTLGASGAIMGLFGAMVGAGARLRSERDSLVRAASVVLATLVYGFLQQGVSNAAHIGGLVAGLWLAIIFGTDPVWTAAVRRHEWSRLVASEREWDEAIRHQPPPAVSADPVNRLVLRMSTSQRWGWWTLASFLPLLFVGDLVYLTTSGRAPTGAELEFAGLSLLMALASILLVRVTFGHLELAPNGFREISLRRGPLVPWIDVEHFFTSELYYVKYVAYYLTPAAQVQGSFLSAAARRVRTYGMPAKQQAELMEEWRRRWTQ